MTNKFFPEIKNNFGFGCMRLAMKGDNVDTTETSKMVDYFIENGFNYFDTAHGYISTQSETALKTCLTTRYARDKFVLTDKLTEPYFSKQEDIKPFVESQLEACGVEYFDFYLCHALTAQVYPKFTRCKAFDVLKELKAQGKIHHIGISFHDKAEVLEMILSEHPEIEIVQIQFNYVDYDDAGVQSRKCYKVCEKFKKPVLVMEPVKGGGLVNLPLDAKKIFDDLNESRSTKKLSYASYAIRFAASFPNICTVLSGMGNMEMMKDNVSFMKNFKPLDDVEMNAIVKVTDILKNQHSIQCTACHYCTDGCPEKIRIPDLFADYNAKKVFKDWNSDFYFGVHTTNAGKPSACIKCGKCEKSCPQHLPIRKLLATVAEVFEH